MKTDDLILELARDAAPVRPLRPPLARLAAWLVVAGVSVAAGVLVYGLRTDSATMASVPGFGRDVVFAGVVALLGAGTALVLAVPGAERHPIVRALAVASVAAWIALAATAVIDRGTGFAGAADWPICAIRVVSVALVPAGYLLMLVRRAAPFRPAWMAGLGGAAALAAGSLAVQLVCPITAPAHVLLGHVAPVGVFGLLAAAVAAARRDGLDRRPRHARASRRA